MAAIRSKDTAPELAVRRYLHAAGLRYRLCPRELPGRPDLVFPSRRVCVFVHGCFWHAHDCKTAHRPKSNADYWGPKLKRNQARDKNNLKALTAIGWKPLVIWECEIKFQEKLEKQMAAFLR